MVATLRASFFESEPYEQRYYIFEPCLGGQLAHFGEKLFFFTYCPSC